MLRLIQLQLVSLSVHTVNQAKQRFDGSNLNRNYTAIPLKNVQQANDMDGRFLTIEL